MVWKLTWPLDHDSHYQSCVRTIVVWKRYGRPVVQQGHKLLRENHSGMETGSLAPTTQFHRSTLRENHSGMETDKTFSAILALTFVA